MTDHQLAARRARRRRDQRAAAVPNPRPIALPDLEARRRSMAGHPAGTGRAVRHAQVLPFPATSR